MSETDTDPVVCQSSRLKVLDRHGNSATLKPGKAGLFSIDENGNIKASDGSRGDEIKLALQALEGITNGSIVVVNASNQLQSISPPTGNSILGFISGAMKWIQNTLGVDYSSSDIIGATGGDVALLVQQGTNTSLRKLARTKTGFLKVDADGVYVQGEEIGELEIPETSTIHVYTPISQEVQTYAAQVKYTGTQNPSTPISGDFPVPSSVPTNASLLSVKVFLDGDSFDAGSNVAYNFYVGNNPGSVGTWVGFIDLGESSTESQLSTTLNVDRLSGQTTVPYKVVRSGAPADTSDSLTLNVYITVTGYYVPQTFVRSS